MKYSDYELEIHDYITHWSERNSELLVLLADEMLEYSGMEDEYRCEMRRNERWIYEAKLQLAVSLSKRGISYREFIVEVSP